MKKVYSLFGKKCWIVDSNGKRICKKSRCITSSHVGPFEVFITDSQYIVCHKNGNAVYISNDTCTVSRICDNVYAVKEVDYLPGKKVAVMLYDYNGNRIPTNITDIGMLSNGLIAAKDGKKWGYVDELLAWKIMPEWESARMFSKFGYAIVKFKGDKEAVINKRGTYMFSPTNIGIERILSKDRVLVGREVIFGVINMKGETIVPVEYNNIKMISNHFVVYKNGKYGLLDIDGNEVFPCEFLSIEEKDGKFFADELVKREIDVTRKEI